MGSQEVVVPAFTSGGIVDTDDVIFLVVDIWRKVKNELQSLRTELKLKYM